MGDDATFEMDDQDYIFFQWIILKFIRNYVTNVWKQLCIYDINGVWEMLIHSEVKLSLSLICSACCQDLLRLINGHGHLQMRVQFLKQFLFLLNSTNCFVNKFY